MVITISSNMPFWGRALDSVGGKGTGDQAVCILQESRYPAPSLAAASVSRAFATWHSICVPTAHPHNPWKVGPG